MSNFRGALQNIRLYLLCMFYLLFYGYHGCSKAILLE